MAIFVPFAAATQQSDAPEWSPGDGFGQDEFVQLSHDVEKLGAARLGMEFGSGTAIGQGGIELPGGGAIVANLVGELLGFVNVAGIESRT